jgi:hypothetical protein
VSLWAWTDVTLPATELCVRVMVTSETPLVHWLAHLCSNTGFFFFFLSTSWSWQQSMREGFEGLFVASWLDIHYTVAVGYTAVLCPSVKYILCYLEHSWTISWTGDQVLCHSSPSLAMRRNLSWIYCAQLSVWSGISVKTIWNCLSECVWSDPVGEVTLRWHTKERVVYLSTVFCAVWQGLYFIFLNIYINVSWRAVAFCYRLYNWKWNCYWVVPALFKIMYLFIYYFNQHVRYYFVLETFVFCVWPISRALGVPTVYRVQLLKTTVCHKFSYFWKAVLFLVRCSIVCV